MSEAAVIVRHNPGETSLAGGGSVLIIDDEAEIRESLETLLEMEGYGVESAASGEEGLARIGERSFDLVLLDLALAGPQRLGFIGGDSRPGSGALDHHGHRLRHGGKCGEGDAGGRGKFCPEALG